MGPAPIPDNLRQPTLLERARYRYEASVVDRIMIAGDVSGLVAVRRWRLHPGMYIVSAYRNLKYSSSVIWADRVPTARNTGGIYAWLPAAAGYLLETPVIRDGVIGIVELTRRVVIHEDGTLRGERCKILTLIARREFASRLSRIYGVPVVAVSCEREARAKIASWLCSSEGVMLLKRNLDRVSDAEVRRLLRQVEGLEDESEHGQLDDVPDGWRDRGEVIGDKREAKRRCSGRWTLIVRNGALEGRFPGGVVRFANLYGCASNGRISVLEGASAAELNEPLAGLLASGLSQEDDYVLMEPMCFRCCAVNPKRKGVPRSTRLHVDWLKTEIGWLNASVEGHFHWREAVAGRRRTSKALRVRRRGITGWIKRVLGRQ